ncbi:MAG: PIN domain-containing protein [Actinomycetota bacterium]|nr:PIN domain-containing protein [Actinomycetota bacterium]
MPDYLDTSAFIKLVRSEPESRALRAELATGGALVSSALLVVEGRRGSARYGPLALSRAVAALGAITLLPIDDATLERAATLEPLALRSLDSLHLAAALSLAADLGCIYCYDARLFAAGSSLGLDLRRPH